MEAMSNSFKITPIGGLGQIGANMLLIETDNESTLVDCGILFPKDDNFNIDYLLPDYSVLPDNCEQIILTHGHEDHIGGIAHIKSMFPKIKLWCPHFCYELINNKIGAKANIFTEADCIKTKDLEIFPIQVNHSIPETFGLLINHYGKKKSLLYISDFKVSKNCTNEPAFIVQDIEKKIPKGFTRILMSDSTNATSKNLKTPDEDEVVPQFEKIFKEDHKRFFVTTFPSNIFRLNNIAKTAHKQGFKLYCYGLSMESYLSVLKNYKLKDNYARHIQNLDKSSEIPKEKIVVLVSGCQAQLRSTFRRIATGNDNFFTPEETDLFVISARSIPGNEANMALCLNGISEHGASIYTASDLMIHTSGHGGLSDLKIVYDSFKPDLAIPIHGETFFLKRHCDFIKSSYTQTTPLLMTNNDSLEFLDGAQYKHTKTEAPPPVMYRDKRPLTKTILNIRRKLAQNGIISAVINKDLKVSFVHHGIIDFEEKIYHDLQKTLNSTAKQSDINSIEESIRLAIRRYFTKKCNARPEIIIHKSI
jgi:ribonuclease J